MFLLNRHKSLLKQHNSASAIQLAHVLAFTALLPRVNTFHTEPLMGQHWKNDSMKLYQKHWYNAYTLGQFSIQFKCVDYRIILILLRFCLFDAKQTNYVTFLHFKNKIQTWAKKLNKEPKMAKLCPIPYVKPQFQSTDDKPSVKLQEGHGSIKHSRIIDGKPRSLWQLIFLGISVTHVDSISCCWRRA